MPESTTPERCDKWLGDMGWYCGAAETKRYLPGWRCLPHSPAALAGRKVPVPDPKRTMAGLQAAWQARHQATIDRQAARAAGLKVFRGPSGPHGRYTSADVSMAAVHRAMRQVGDRVEARRQEWLATRSTAGAP